MNAQAFSLHADALQILQRKTVWYSSALQQIFEDQMFFSESALAVFSQFEFHLKRYGKTSIPKECPDHDTNLAFEHEMYRDSLSNKKHCDIWSCKIYKVFNVRTKNFR